MEIDSYLKRCSMDPIIDFLKERKLPKEATEAQIVKRQAMKYTLHDR